MDRGQWQYDELVEAIDDLISEQEAIPARSKKPWRPSAARHIGNLERQALAREYPCEGLVGRPLLAQRGEGGGLNGGGILRRRVLRRVVTNGGLGDGGLVANA